MAKIEAKTEKSKTKSRKKPKVRVYNKIKKVKDSDIIEKLQAKYETVEIDKITKFSDIALSPKTIKGLRECGYHQPTEIQKQSILLALQGNDILGAAQTGSGKTLAFLIPILERLFCKQWTKVDGLGALVITPTRELGYQIFETLKNVGKHHDFSAGLIIGGKDLKIERNCMDKFNIIICTPGRILQHIELNPLFNCDNLELLVLDEADRCLDMGFEQTMNAIIASLPPQRQTLLFSATQTKSVKDLVRLSLKDPKYIGVNEFTTPKELKQSYIICELKDKMNILWSFIKNHPKKKIIVFFACCKQVKYVYEMFCKLRPGMSLMALYGTLHQLRRMDIYESFCRKQSAVLFATDLAARGLDFPAVNWVVQMDCPEDVAMYIHRVGRTARYNKDGESVLLLMKSELKMLEYIEEKKIPIERIDINETKVSTPIQKMQTNLIHDGTLRDTARRAVICYVRTIFLMRDKSIFDVYALDIESYAKSLGLEQAPRVRFLQRAQQRSSKSDKSGNNKTKYVEENDSDYEDFLTVNRRMDNNDDNSADAENILELEDMTRNSKKASKKPQTKVAIAKKLLKKQNIKLNKKTVFNDEGEAVVPGVDNTRKTELAQEFENEDTGGIDLEKAMAVRKEEDIYDKAVFKAKVKAKHKEIKKKLQEEKKKLQDEKKKKNQGNDDDADEVVDDFGEDSDDEPDTSWLPDPDKIYGHKETEDDSPKEKKKNHEKLAQAPNEEEVKSKKKRKLDKLPSSLNVTGNKKRNHEKLDQDANEEEVKKKKKRKLDKLTSSLNVTEAEQFAMMLLQK